MSLMISQYLGSADNRVLENNLCSADMTTAAKVARMPAKHCMQTHLDRHKDHTNYLFTVTMTPPLTHEQCRHRICALCYCEHGRKADRWISKKEEKLLEDFIPQYCTNNPQMPGGVCKWWWFCLVKISSMPHLSSNFRFRCIFDVNAHNDNKRIDRGDWAGQKVEIHPLLPASYTCGDYRPSTRASLDFKCVCRICKFARMSGGEAMKLPYVPPPPAPNLL